MERTHTYIHTNKQASRTYIHTFMHAYIQPNHHRPELCDEQSIKKQHSQLNSQRNHQQQRQQQQQHPFFGAPSATFVPSAAASPNLIPVLLCDPLTPFPPAFRRIYTTERAGNNQTLRFQQLVNVKKICAATGPTPRHHEAVDADECGS